MFLVIYSFIFLTNVYSQQRSASYYYKLSFKAQGIDKKISILKQALEINQRYAPANSQICALYSIKGEHQTAQMYCEMAAAYGGQNAKYYWQVAQNLYNQGQYSQAIGKAGEALQFAEFYPPLHEVQANSYFVLGRYRAAIEKYTMAINFDSTNPYHLANRAKAFIYEGGSQAYQEAYYDCAKAVKIAPNFSQGYTCRGETHLALAEMMTGQAKEERLNMGLADLQKAIKLDAKSPQAYRLLGYYYLVNEQYDNAKANFLNMLKYDIDNPETHLYMGIYYIEVNEKNKAIISLENAFKTGFENIKQIEDPEDGFGRYYTKLKDELEYQNVISKWKETLKHKKGITAVEIYK